MVVLYILPYTLVEYDAILEVSTLFISKSVLSSSTTSSMVHKRATQGKTITINVCLRPTVISHLPQWNARHRQAGKRHSVSPFTCHKEWW